MSNSDNGTELYCSKCNKKTVHGKLSASEVEARKAEKNNPKYKILHFVFSVNQLFQVYCLWNRVQRD